MFKKIFLVILIGSLLLSGCKMKTFAQKEDETLSLKEEYKKYYALNYPDNSLSIIKDVTNDVFEELLVLTNDKFYIYTLNEDVKKIYEQNINDDNLYIYEDNAQTFFINKLNADYEYEIFKLGKDGKKDITKIVTQNEKKDIKKSFDEIVTNSKNIKDLLNTANTELALEG